MAVDDVYRLTAILRAAGDQPSIVNTFHFKALEATVFDTQEEDLVEAFQAEAEDAYREQFTNRLTVFQYKVGKSPTFETAFIKDVSGVVGNLSGDSLGVRNSAVLSFRTATLSKRGRGRLFLPPANEAANGADGHPTSGYIDNMEFFADKLLGMASTVSVLYASYELQVWSKADQAAYPVTAFTARNFWGSQRDRKAY
jgi:hypothetical protein